mgnify:FL=1|tara:strand:+ start:328 stop:549 length:222 start_codon:yes stop_codon:yes gene_type:complete
MPSNYKYPKEFTKQSKQGEMSDVGTALHRESLDKRLLGKTPEDSFVNTQLHASQKSAKMMPIASKTIKMGDMG